MLSRREGVVLLPVRVQPGAARTALRGELDGRLRVAVAAPPEKGKANKALLRALARWLGVSRSAVEVRSGHTHRNKVVAVEAAAEALVDALGTADITFQIEELR